MFEAIETLTLQIEVLILNNITTYYNLLEQLWNINFHARLELAVEHFGSSFAWATRNGIARARSCSRAY